ncbi:MAG: protein translocase subunit SecF [Candidatus Aphodocola sp.]
MKKGFIKRIVIFFVVIALFSLIYVPLFNDMKFGLDLKGGFEVLYQVKRSDGKKLTTNDMNSTYDVLKRNVDSLGVSEPEITMEGTDRIRVKLAGVTDIKGARKALSNVANISFRDTNDKLLMDSSVIKGARLSYDESGKPAISLQVADKEKFLEATTEVSQKESGENLMVIWYNFEKGVNSYVKDKDTCGNEDSMCLSAATVSQGFSSDVIITGNFEKEEAESLATSINAGSITTKLNEISSQNVNASYGEGVLSKTLIAGVIGMILVILFMTLLYKFSGFISGINLLLYMLLVMGIFWLVGGVLTLPGIAALVLGIGMAVDSCVVTNERIKEELQTGSNLKNAYEAGNSESWSTIFDANVTTLIVAIVLFIFGESSVKGFATMLMITIFATMFIMVFLNRKILKSFVNTKFFDKKPNNFIRYKKKNNKSFKKVKINSINLIKKCMIVTATYLIIGIIYLCINGLNLGIDFKAGTDITLSANKITVNEVKKDIEKMGYNISSIEKQEKGEIHVRLSDELKEKGINKVNAYFEDKYDAKSEINVITNIVKQDLVKNAIYSVLIAAIAIIIYISIRFKFSYAISSILTLTHDVLFVIILFSLLKIEVNVIFIAAILTIVGYSINNTIVVFDRIRENISNYNKKLTKEELKEVVNNSISDTFNRAIYTTLTTLIPVICLMILGSKGILPFNLALIFGLVAGTYSSILLAGQIWYLFEKKNCKKER